MALIGLSHFALKFVLVCHLFIAMSLMCLALWYGTAISEPSGICLKSHASLNLLPAVDAVVLPCLGVARHKCWERGSSHGKVVLQLVITIFLVPVETCLEVKISRGWCTSVAPAPCQSSKSLKNKLNYWSWTENSACTKTSHGNLPTIL